MICRDDLLKGGLCPLTFPKESGMGCFPFTSILEKDFSGTVGEFDMYPEEFWGHGRLKSTHALKSPQIE